MTQKHVPRRARTVAVATAIGVSAIAAVPAGASAADPNSCDASALQISLLGGAPTDPIRANVPFTPCGSDDRSLANLPLLGLAQVDAVRSTTTVVPKVSATSNAQVVGAKVGVTGPVVDSLLGPLLGTGSNSIVGDVVGGAGGASSAVGGAAGPLGGLLNNLVGGIALSPGNNGSLLSSLTANLPAALRAALPDVLSAGVIRSTAVATCSNGSARLSGSSQIADLKVLGTAIDANAAANQVLALDTTNLNLGKLLSVDDLLKNIKVSGTGILGPLLVGGQDTNLFDLLHTGDAGLIGQIRALTGQTLPQLLDAVTSTLQPLLNQVTIALPEGLLRAVIAPNQQTTVNGVLTQQTLSVGLTVLGQPVLAAVLAQARVGTGAAGCAPASPASTPTKFSSPEAAEILKCSKNPSQLIDVHGSGSRTYVEGIAEKKLVGKTAVIYLRDGKKRVGKTKVRSNGRFSTRVALPPSSIRFTNRARYYAVIGGKKTKALKFGRRMDNRSLTSKARRVTFKGKVVAPLMPRQEQVLIKQRVTCKTYKVVARVKPDSKGRFTVRLTAPKGIDAAVYRAQTHVIKRTGSTKRFPTYTLPRVVGVG